MYDRTQALADKIVEGLAEENLYKLTQNKDFPSRWTILRWIDEDVDFATRCARAEKLRAAKRAAKIEELADQCTEANFQSMKVKISTAQWLASKEDAKYGDRTPGDSPTNPLHLKVNREEALAKLIGTGAAPQTTEPQG